VREIRTLIGTAWSLDRRRVLTQLVLLVLNGLLGGVGLLLLIPIVNSVADTVTTVQVPIIGGISLEDISLPLLLGAFMVLVVAQALVAYRSSVNSARLQQVLVDQLRHEAFAAVLRARWNYVTSLRRSDIIQTITTGSMRSGTAVNLLLTALVTLITALATAIVAILVSPFVSGLAVFGVLFLAVVQGRGVGTARRLGRMSTERNKTLQAVVVDSLDSLRLVRAHHASGVWIDRLADAFTSARDVQLAAVEKQSLSTAISTVATAAAAATLVLIASSADVEPASIIIIIILIGRLSRNAQSLVRTAIQLANALPAVSDISDLTSAALVAEESPSDEEGHGGVLPTTEGKPLVTFREVTYAYPEGGRGVRKIDLIVPVGRITVITGPSGAGKSTLADLALGLLTPQSGQVDIGQTILIPSLLAWWRRHVSYVPQETVLIPGNLRDNLVWSVPGGASDDECRVALEKAAATFVDRLPDGLDSILGDKGIRLSGGERQRVAIARALLRRPTLLVLDEATSSLDDDTESAVLDTVGQLTPAVTVLVIAHRQSTIEAADHVVRLEDGQRVA
jgi:ATP-binding cassette subfamily C protein